MPVEKVIVGAVPFIVCLLLSLVAVTLPAGGLDLAAEPDDELDACSPMQCHLRALT